MEHPVQSLHHVTATVDDAQADLNFYRQLLGLRLVKRTVNFDNHNVYHFYYGDERGTPGTIWTTFPYKGWGVPVGDKGAGQVTVTSFSVPTGSLGFWDARLREQGVVPEAGITPFGEPTLTFEDPSGLVVQLIETKDDPRAPWTSGGVDASGAIRGLHNVTLTVRSPERTLAMMSELLGFRVTDEAEGRYRVATGSAGPGHILEVEAAPSAPAAHNGVGTVHHVALAIASEEEQLRLRDEIIRYGLRPTEVRDRCYFRSIYFREPGGVLLEIATAGPGFDVDESRAELGKGLQLPPWEEPNRSAIVKGLPPISDTAAGA